MLELFHAALEPVILPYSILLVVVLIYWGSILLGALDFSALDIDFDLDADIDADVDMDVDADTDVDGSATGWFAGLLHFFNFGKLPLMIILSITVLSAWSLAILGNYYVGQNSWGFALATLIPNLFVSLLVAKIITTPLVPLFERLDGTAEAIDYIGQTCRIRLPAGASKFGQAEVIIDDDALLINVKTDSDANVIQRGESAVVVGKTSDGKYYLVEKREE